MLHKARVVGGIRISTDQWYEDVRSNVIGVARG